MNTQELPTEAQAYLRDAAQYIFDTYGNEALQRLTDDFDGCMKQFHDHRMEVLKKLQTPEGVALIRELTLGKLREREKGKYVIEDLYTDHYVRDLNGLEVTVNNLEWTPDKSKAKRFQSKDQVNAFQAHFRLRGWTAVFEY